MSPNDTYNDDNPQIPMEADVVPMDRVEAIRERLRAEEAAGKDRNFIPEDDDIPPEQEFAVTLEGETVGEPGIVVNYRGYMVATSVFVGFADSEGIIKGLVPMNKVLYVEPVEPRSVNAA